MKCVIIFICTSFVIHFAKGVSLSKHNEPGYVSTAKSSELEKHGLKRYSNIIKYMSGLGTPGWHKHIDLVETTRHRLSPLKIYTAVGKLALRVYENKKDILRSHPLSRKHRRRSLPTDSQTYVQCMGDMDVYTDGIIDSLLDENYTLPVWAEEMFDSMGKIPTGLYDGNLHWVGQFEECVNMTTVNATRTFKGKYCFNNMQFDGINITIGLGSCYSNSCSSEDAKSYMNTFLDELNDILDIVDAGFKIPIKLAGVACSEAPPDPSTNPKYKAAISITLIFVIIGVAASIFDGIIGPCLPGNHIETADAIAPPSYKEVKASTLLSGVPNTNSQQAFVSGYQPVEESDKARVSTGSSISLIPVYENVRNATKVTSVSPNIDSKEKIKCEDALRQICFSFSLLKNTPRVFATNIDSAPIPVLNAIRFLSLSWLIVAFNYALPTAAAERLIVSNIARRVIDLPEQWTFQPIINATLASDAFLVISGLLTTYHFLKKVDANFRKINFSMMVYYYLHKLWVIIPGYMFVLMFYSCMYPYISGGPLYPGYVTDANNCYKNWWANLIFLNNFIRTDEMCMNWAVYLPMYMQLYWVSPLILVPLSMLPIAGYIAIVVFFIIHFVCVATISAHVYSLPPDDQFTQFYRQVFITPWCRAGPYLIGIVLGYILKKTDCKPKINAVMAILGWAVSLVCILSVTYGSYGEYRKGGKEWTTPVNVLYDTVSRSVFGLGVAWIIYACVTGFGGIANSILSWSAFQPLGRLTFVSFLVSGPVCLSNVYAMKRLLYIDTLNIGNNVIAVTALTYGISFIITVLVVYPLRGLEEVLYKCMGLRKSVGQFPSKSQNGNAMPTSLKQNEINAPVGDSRQQSTPL